MSSMYLSNTLAFDDYIHINNRRINEVEQTEHSNDKHWMKKGQSCELQLIGTRNSRRCRRPIIVSRYSHKRSIR